MTAMMERELDTLRFPHGSTTHFVRRTRETWLGSTPGIAYTFCGREGSANEIVPRKFSTVRNWCLICYWSRHKALDEEFGVDTRYARLAEGEKG